MVLPHDNLRDVAEGAIDAATEGPVWLMSYLVPCVGTVRALTCASERGCDVRLIIDPGPSERRRYDLPFPCRQPKVSDGSLHTKALIFNDRAFAGSFNFGGSLGNFDFLAVHESPEAVAQFKAHFEAAWVLPEADPLLRGDEAYAFVVHAAEKLGWDSFLTKVAQRAKSRGYLTTKEEAAIRRALE